MIMVLLIGRDWKTLVKSPTLGPLVVPYGSKGSQSQLTWMLGKHCTVVFFS